MPRQDRVDHRATPGGVEHQLARTRQVLEDANVGGRQTWMPPGAKDQAPLQEVEHIEVWRAAGMDCAGAAELLRHFDEPGVLHGPQ